jgi:hypothetical protein
MNYRAFFWTVAFVLPVTAAIVVSISLQRERTAMEAMIAQLTASSLQIDSSQQENTTQRQASEQERNSIEADIKKIGSTLSPWQKRLMAVTQAASQVSAEARPRGTALLDQPSATQLYFPQLLNDPVYHNAVAALEKQEVEEKFGRLFDALALSPADQGKLESLLTQQQMARVDARELANSGPKPASPTATGAQAMQAELSTASSDAVKPVNKEIQTAFGGDIWHKISAYEGILQFYNTTDEMETRLQYSPTPLAPGQADQVVGLLVQALGPKVYSSYWIVPQSVIAQAPSVLSPPQVDVLITIQQEQKAKIQAHNIRQAAKN